MTEHWRVHLMVNGQPADLEVAPLTTLAEILRDQLGLRGTKIGCNKGECGACSVLMDGELVNSCLVLAPQADGAEIWTIEGLSNGKELHPLQEAFVREGAIQCGFCTPGMIMAGVALLRKTPHPTEEEIKRGIAGNLCRCTGYQKIVRAIQSCVEELEHTGRRA